MAAKMKEMKEKKEWPQTPRQQLFYFQYFYWLLPFQRRFSSGRWTTSGIGLWFFYYSYDSRRCSRGSFLFSFISFLKVDQFLLFIYSRTFRKREWKERNFQSNVGTFLAALGYESKGITAAKSVCTNSWMLWPSIGPIFLVQQLLLKERLESHAVGLER